MNPKYLKMIKSMKKGRKKEWSVYILRCGDGSFYTGVAKNVEARFKSHSEGKGARYTKTHLPVELVYERNGFTHSQALVREAGIKALPRAKKEKLVCSGEGRGAVPEKK